MTNLISRTALALGALACLAAWPLAAQDAQPFFKPDRPVEELPMDTPEQRSALLAALYGQLGKAATAQDAQPVTEAIERLWLYTGSDTISLLMERSLKAVGEKNSKLAIDLLDAVTELAPDFAEGWNRRAYVHYTRNDYQRALGDIRRVLALEPNHYKALDGLGQILREIGEKKAALTAFRQLLAIHPQWPNIQQTVSELDREVEGQGI